MSSKEKGNFHRSLLSSPFFFFFFFYQLSRSPFLVPQQSNALKWHPSFDDCMQVPNEADGGGLNLNLRVHEMCKKYLKPHGPVLASLHVNVNSGRSNDITKCKELLAFIKEQVLPKTLKMVSLKRLKNIKTDEKKEGGNWLRCIWPGKKVKRFAWEVTLLLIFNPLILPSILSII